MKGAANTCPTVDSLYKNLLHPGVFDTVVVFKRHTPRGKCASLFLLLFY